IDIALAYAAGCASRSFIYIWNSFAVFQKRPATGGTFLHAAVLGDCGSLDCSRNRAKFLADITPMDGAHVADFHGCNPGNRCLGRNYIGFPLASAAVLSRTRSGLTQFN